MKVLDVPFYFGIELLANRVHAHYFLRVLLSRTRYFIFDDKEVTRSALFDPVTRERNCPKGMHCSRESFCDYDRNFNHTLPAKAGRRKRRRK